MRTFSNLAKAVRFLTTALDANDYDALAEACQEELPKDWVLEALRQQNAATPLVKLYAGRKFPLIEREFKLGGHDKELGHIHIDFVRSRAGWKIHKIWMCR